MPRCLRACSAALFALLATASAVSPVDGQDAAGLFDLVVYDPGVHERGLPKAIFEDIGEERLTIDIPPKVHVHRYYYSGDKEVQGPIITGGPVVVVASHPKTGERMYVDAVLPQGAPRIAYAKRSITYVYPDQRVSIQFRKFPFSPCKAVVKYHSGRGPRRRVDEFVSQRTDHVKQHLANSPAVESLKKAADSTHDVLADLKDTTVNGVKQVHTAVKTVAGIIPGVTPLLNPSGDRTTRRYRGEVQAAASRASRTAAEFVPTVR